MEYVSNQQRHEMLKEANYSCTCCGFTPTHTLNCLMLGKSPKEDVDGLSVLCGRCYQVGKLTSEQRKEYESYMEVV